MTLDRDWIPEAVDDFPGSHELSFSDEVAHERQDLVSRAVEFLAAMGEVDDVYQEDRERVHVDIADGGEGSVMAAFGEWWDDISTDDLRSLQSEVRAAHQCVRPGADDPLLTEVSTKSLSARPQPAPSR